MDKEWIEAATAAFKAMHEQGQVTAAAAATLVLAAAVAQLNHEVTYNLEAIARAIRENER